HKAVDEEVFRLPVPVEVDQQVAPLVLDLRQQLVPLETADLAATGNRVVRIAGDGPPVVVLHRGFSFSRRSTPASRVGGVTRLRGYFGWDRARHAGRGLFQSTG